MSYPKTIDKDLNEFIGIAIAFQSRAQIFGEFGKGTKNKKLEIVTRGSNVFFEVSKDKKSFCKFESLYCSVKAYLAI